MDLPSDVRAVLFDAGSEAVAFNAPLSSERAERLVDRLGAVTGERPVVADLGCGWGAMSRLVASRLTGATVVGVDLDESSIGRARARAEEASLGDRVRFEVADAADWDGPGDPLEAVLCVAASHAFGGTAAMFSRLAELVPTGAAMVGDGLWQSPPDDWCREAFGEPPTGLDGLVAEAERAGWTIVDADTSTLDEWDEFEGAWIDGVRSVGTPVARAFADERAADRDRYRSVLGFGWLVLRR